MNDYIEKRDEEGPKIHAAEGDEYVRIAMVHFFGVMAAVSGMFCRYFRIDRPDIMEALRTTWTVLAP